jgi:hypothetical protein
MAILLNVKYLRIIGDWELVIWKNVNKYKTINPKLIPYHELVVVLLKQFKKATHKHVSISGNIFANALANLSYAFCRDLTLDYCINLTCMCSCSNLLK